MILGAEPITHIERAPGSRATGRWVEGATTSTTIYASVQPLEGKTRKALSSAYRDRDGRELWTTSTLKPVDQSTGQSGDLVVVDGVSYEVVSVKPWRAVIPHFHAVVIALGESL